MDLVTHSMLVLSAVCLTIAGINLRFWLGERKHHKFLAIAVACVSAAAYSWFEVAWLHAETPIEFANLLRWSQIPGVAAVVSLGVFLYLHLGAGRIWLLYMILGLRLVATAINAVVPVNIVFTEITAIGHHTILGENLAYPIGTASPFVGLMYAAALLLVVFSIDAAITVWRRGQRRKALVFGVAMTLFAAFTIILSVISVWGLLSIPAFVSPSFLFLLIALGLELNYDVQRSARLARELAEQKFELIVKDQALSVTKGELIDIKSALDQSSILTITDEKGKIVTVNQKFCEISGYSEAELLGQDHRIINSGHHPKDFIRNLWTTIQSGDIWRGEIRNKAKNGRYYWVDTTIVPFKDPSGKIYQYVSIRNDITQRKLAEAEAHQLSSKLMNAQEKERARLARELHDDLSQSLALLSIQLQVLGKKQTDPATIKKRVDELTEQIQRLSTDVHRISHELHPSKLVQLGLEAALRGFCRETGAARGMKIGFDAENVPRDLPKDIALCVYRIAQEGLQNAIKHSGASFANIVLLFDDGVLKLIVSDNGCGFDPEEVKSKESLGLVSMDERVRAVNGTLKIESVIDSGTKIEAHVPLSSD